ncbi:MAG TPA: MBL fold metallo-hydrolase [Candidatus Hydrogenedentes bacterium]|nr:MBL fold metallo-hydrolase [Candidatus Hydrogenedentota bacterium]
MGTKMTRRDLLKASGVTAGGLVLGASTAPEGCDPEISDPKTRNTYFAKLKPYYPGTETLGEQEMRITFLGTTCLPRLTQACNSVFVELGNGESFVFDCGTGVIPKYYAMNIGLRKMDKIFLTHLHADHFSDLIFIYGFGPSDDRRTPLYVWGPSKSNVVDPIDQVTIYEDGTAAFCKSIQDAMRWHNESQSFLPSSVVGYTPPAWAPQDKVDAYDLVGFDVPWNETSVVYQDDEKGVTITAFPAVHCRQGSVSYKLEWNGLSMIFAGDTKPNYYMVDAASPGVDVLIHEIVVPVDVWAERATGVSPSDTEHFAIARRGAQMVQDSSHTPQRAFGYILSQLEVPPRLAVGTHFQAADDTIEAAMADIRAHYPQGDLIIATDLMVINVTKDLVEARRAVVSDFTWQPPVQFDRTLGQAKYSNEDGSGNPTMQLDPNARLIDPALWEA